MYTLIATPHGITHETHRNHPRQTLLSTVGDLNSSTEAVHAPVPFHRSISGHPTASRSGVDGESLPTKTASLRKTDIESRLFRWCIVSDSLASSGRSHRRRGSRRSGKLDGNHDSSTGSSWWRADGRMMQSRCCDEDRSRRRRHRLSRNSLNNRLSWRRADDTLARRRRFGRTVKFYRIQGGSARKSRRWRYCLATRRRVGSDNRSNRSRLGQVLAKIQPRDLCILAQIKGLAGDTTARTQNRRKARERSRTLTQRVSNLQLSLRSGLTGEALAPRKEPREAGRNAIREPDRRIGVAGLAIIAPNAPDCRAAWLALVARRLDRGVLGGGGGVGRLLSAIA